MITIIRNMVKKIILAILPDSERLRSLAYRPKLETWRKQHAGSYPIFNSRYAIYDYINNEIFCGRPIQYLEFGVYKGDTIKYFSNLNSNPDSRFVGFDTFTGLPEDWIELTRTVKRSTFDTNGEPPQLHDVRISFVKGLFQDTLPGFLEAYSSKEQLVIHNDSDLYSSTLYMLTRANNIIKPGTIIIFDEFYSVMHEFRALEDYCAAYMRNYSVIAATRNHLEIAIRMQ
ncbi:MAG: macrocin O-methyltransferase [Gammaproteobacteria bacterium]|nr:MAG: macrocin O-methyltransferase [Gammaproteobacteria bacterium]QOJ20587.1 MAG: macrocin O-methyltransferase [Gammaproteobacteria bacterium]